MLGHHREHLTASLLKQSQDNGGFIGRDAAGDPQNDPHGIVSILRCRRIRSRPRPRRFFQDFPGDESLLRFLNGDVAGFGDFSSIMGG